MWFSFEKQVAEADDEVLVHIAVAIAGFGVLTSGVIVPTWVGIDRLHVLQHSGHLHVGRDGANQIHHRPCNSCW